MLPPIQFQLVTLNGTAYPTHIKRHNRPLFWGSDEYCIVDSGVQMQHCWMQVCVWAIPGWVTTIYAIPSSIDQQWVKKVWLKICRNAEFWELYKLYIFALVLLLLIIRSTRILALSHSDNFSSPSAVYLYFYNFDSWCRVSQNLFIKNRE